MRVTARDTTAEPGDAIRRFDLAMQRAVGAGLAVACVLATATAVLGYSLYPSWWWIGPGPAGLACAAAAAWLCLTGRFTGWTRPAFVLVMSVSAIVAAVATGSAVRDVGTAVMPIVVITIVGIGFLSVTPAAALLGGVLVACDTLVPAVLRPDDAGDLLVQAAIQTLILMSGFAGGQLARRFAVAEDRALDELAGTLAADRAASAARAERRELEREMHDTVLSTLSALGRESLRDSDAVRGRCAADARFLRTRGRADDAPGAELRDRLDAVVATFTAEGFPVELTLVDPPAELPAGVAQAMVRATREALNNARQHSGAGRARIEVRSAASRLTVDVIDEGNGADDDGAPRLGTRRSLLERLDDVGGQATVARTPGAGTTVTLQWPR